MLNIFHDFNLAVMHQICSLWPRQEIWNQTRKQKANYYIHSCADLLLFRRTATSFLLWNFLFNWNFDEDSPEAAKENFLGVNFSQSRGKFRFVGKFGNNQHWWCLTIQPAIVRPIYAERGTISKSWQGHNKAQGNIHSELQRQEFIKLEEKNVFFFEAK